MIEERDFHRTIKHALEDQAERLKVRTVIARRADGVDEPLCIIQTLTDNGVTVYVEHPSRGEAERDGSRWRFARTIFSIEDIEWAVEEMRGSDHLEEENVKADAAIDAAMLRGTSKREDASVPCGPYGRKQD